MTKQELEWKPAPLYVETMAEVEELKKNALKLERKPVDRVEAMQTVKTMFNLDILADDEYSAIVRDNVILMQNIKVLQSQIERYEAKINYNRSLLERHQYSKAKQKNNQTL